MSKFELPKRQFERTVMHKIPCKTPWRKKMTVSSTFLKSALNFLSSHWKKCSKTWYSQGEKQFQSLNCQKYNLKKQSRTNLPGKTHLDLKTVCFKYIFRISINIPIQ